MSWRTRQWRMSHTLACVLRPGAALPIPPRSVPGSLRSCVKVVQSSCESRCLRSNTNRPPSTSTLSVNFCDFPILVKSPKVTSSFTCRPRGKKMLKIPQGEQQPLCANCPVIHETPPGTFFHVPQRPAQGWSWPYVCLAAAEPGEPWNLCPVGPSGPGEGKGRGQGRTGDMGGQGTRSEDCSWQGHY